MISRLSVIAAVFAVASTAAIALTVRSEQGSPAAVPAAVKQVRVVELPRVVVVGHRTERSAP